MDTFFTFFFWNIIVIYHFLYIFSVYIHMNQHSLYVFIYRYMVIQVLYIFNIRKRIIFLYILQRLQHMLWPFGCFCFSGKSKKVYYLCGLELISSLWDYSRAWVCAGDQWGRSHKGQEWATSDIIVFLVYYCFFLGLSYITVSINQTISVILTCGSD